MATITVEAKRVKAGQALTDFYKQAESAINQLKGIKINLVDLRATIQADSDFAAEDADEIQTKINEFATQVQSILE